MKREMDQRGQVVTPLEAAEKIAIQQRPIFEALFHDMTGRGLPLPNLALLAGVLDGHMPAASNHYRVKPYDEKGRGVPHTDSKSSSAKVLEGKRGSQSWDGSNDRIHGSLERTSRAIRLLRRTLYAGTAFG